MQDKLDLFWHKKTWKKFSSASARDHLPHAMLLTGAKGVGKKIFADKMIKSLLCLKPDPTNRQPCGQCQGCRTYRSGANPDFMRIQLLEGKQQIGVDQIRELSHFLTFSRSFDAYRVILINPVEKMNQNAANSLLKSLEEPSDNTVIILIATHLSTIIPTIVSRSQLLSIPLPARGEAIGWIKAQGSKVDNVEELLEMSAGSPLLALNIDEKSLADKGDFAKDILNIFRENNSVTEIAKKWEKYDQSVLLDWQIIWVQSLLKSVAIASTNSGNQKTKNITRIQKHLDIFKESFPKSLLWQLYFQLLNRKQIVHTSVNPLINLESMLLLWSQASHI